MKEAAREWARHNKCSATPQTAELPDKDPQDGTTVKQEVFRQCQQGADVIVYTIIGGGHTWPGGLQYLPVPAIGKTTSDINGSEIIWEFFSGKTLK